MFLSKFPFCYKKSPILKTILVPPYKKKLPNSIILLKNSGTTDQDNRFIKH